eukprot:179777-Prymnesium_polylepis.1
MPPSLNVCVALSQVEMDLKPANASSADGIYAAYAAQADAAVSAMASTADGLFFKYADGYVTEVTPGGGVKVTAGTSAARSNRSLLWNVRAAASFGTCGRACVFSARSAG